MLHALDVLLSTGTIACITEREYSMSTANVPQDLSMYPNIYAWPLSAISPPLPRSPPCWRPRPCLSPASPLVPCRGCCARGRRRRRRRARRLGRLRLKRVRASVGGRPAFAGACAGRRSGIRLARSVRPLAHAPTAHMCSTRTTTTTARTAHTRQAAVNK